MRDLTKREIAVLGLLTEGCPNKEIARRLRVSEKTASNHITHMQSKLHTSNRVETAVMALRVGLVPWPARKERECFDE